MQRFSRSLNGLLMILWAAACLSAGTAMAAPVDNQQDEYVLFNKNLPEETQEFKVMRTDDKFEMNRYVTRAWELKNADAYEMLPHVKKAVEAEKGKVRTLKYKDPVTGAKRSYIQVVAPEFQIPYLEELIRVLDLPDMQSSEGDVKFNYRLLYRNAKEIASIIENTSLSGEGEIYFDNKTNSVWIKDSVSDFEKDFNTLKFYDVPIPQVALDVEIFEIETDNDATLGLDWDAWKNALGGGLTMERSRSRTENNTLADALTPAIKTLRGYDALLSLDATVLADFINFMVGRGNAKIVTRNKILVSNGDTGILSSLKRIPYQVYDTGAPGRADIKRLEDVTDTTAPGPSGIDQSILTGEKAEGIYIEVSPDISLNSTYLNVMITVNSLNGYTSLGMPIISERKTTTRISINEDTRFTLGVFDKETIMNETESVFLLGRIPVLGFIFRKETDINRKSKLIVFVTPRIKSLELPNATTLDGNTFNADPLLKHNSTDFADHKFEDMDIADME